MAERTGTPTEDPTPRRIKQARDKGSVARSGDLTSATGFAAAVLALAIGGGFILSESVRLMRTGILRAVTDSSPLGSEAVLRLAVMDAGRLILPILGAACVASAVVGGLQAGGLFTLGLVLPRSERLDPWKGARRLASRQAPGELLKSVAKLSAIAAIAWLTLEPRLRELPGLVRARPTQAVSWAGDVGLRLALRVAMAYALLGAADYLWQRRRFWNDLRMTKEEVKREHKETEGDPRHKAERTRLHRDLLRHQMIESVRNADCVVVNPDHLAVALKFDEACMGAPQVVAKGQDLVAQEIKIVARHHGVPIFRNVALAQSLNQLDLGEEIPEALYDAVAEVLRWAYEKGSEQ